MLFQLLRKLFLFSLLFYWKSAPAQSFHIQISSEISPFKISVFSINDNQIKLIDSYTSEKNNLDFQLPKSELYSGFYRLQINDSVNYDFIGGCEDSISFQFNPQSFNTSLVISRNRNNRLLLEFKKEYAQLLQMYSVLQNIDLTNVSKEILNEIQISKQNFTIIKSDLIQSYCDKFTCPSFSTLLRMNDDKYADNIKNYLTYYLPLDDSAVIHTTLFSQHIIDFYAKFGSFDEISFKKNTDTLLKYAKNNEQNFLFLQAGLLKLFATVGPQSIFYYMLENNPVEKNPYLDPVVREKMKKYATFKPGTRIELKELTDDKNRSITSKNITKKTKNNLVVFWDPDCSHCKEILPQLAEIKKKTKNLSIITVALSGDMLPWQKTITEMKIESLKNYRITAAWDSPMVKEMLIYKTPFFLLLDQQGSIIAYDIDYPEILNYIK